MSTHEATAAPETDIQPGFYLCAGYATLVAPVLGALFASQDWTIAMVVNFAAWVVMCYVVAQWNTTQMQNESPREMGKRNNASAKGYIFWGVVVFFIFFKFVF